MNETESITFQLKQKASELQAALLKKDPQMPILLREIHRTIKQYPEQVTLLDPDEIRVVVNGLSELTNTKFIEAVAGKKSSASVSKKIKDMGADAF